MRPVITIGLAFAATLALTAVARADGAETPEDAFDSLVRNEAMMSFTGQKTLIDNQQDPPFIQVTAASLAQAFKDNGLAADGQYGGKKLLISGLFQGARRGALNDPYVELGDGTDFGQSSQLFIENEAMTEAATLKPGQKTELLCDSAEGGIGEALARNCTFYSAYKNQKADTDVQSIRRWLFDGTQSKDVSKPDSRKAWFIIHWLVVRTNFICKASGNLCAAKIGDLFLKTKKEPYKSELRAAYETDRVRLDLPDLPKPKGTIAKPASGK